MQIRIYICLLPSQKLSGPTERVYIWIRRQSNQDVGKNSSSVCYRKERKKKQLKSFAPCTHGYICIHMCACLYTQFLEEAYNCIIDAFVVRKTDKSKFF